MTDTLTIQNSREIANEFNNFFANVGPSLANEIEEPGDVDDLQENLVNKTHIHFSPE